MNAEEIRRRIRSVPDFPKPGILFRDVTPLLLEAEGLRGAVEALAAPFRDARIDRVLGIESRGFILGTPVALHLGVGFGLVRKAGKLPHDTHAATYALEYGSDTVEMHTDAIEPGQRILVVDDLIATGGTAEATLKLVRQAGGEVAGLSFLIELEPLGGRARLGGAERVHSVVRYGD